MINFKFKDVRSFVGEHEIEIRPLTLLIGENSTGKSTLMSLIDIMCEPEFAFSPNFDDEYSLGTFDSIKSSLTKRKSFSLGYIHKNSEIMVYYSDTLGIPFPEKVDIKLSNYLIRVEFDADKDRYIYRVKKNGKFIQNYQEFLFAPNKALGFLIYSNITWAQRNKSIPDDDAEILKELAAKSGIILPSAVLMSPIRNRTYRDYSFDRIKFNRSGKHTPIALANILEDFNPDKQMYLEAYKKFGIESGLFDDIDIYRHNPKNYTSPFQILVKIHGKYVNIFEVGYGVGQIMPIITEAISLNEDEIMLIQQPEVHLHPRAQAAFSSLMVDLLKKGNNSFTIETHSDYIIDRLSFHIKNKDIDSNRIVVYFIDSFNGSATIHKMLFDEFGILNNQPKSYRQFFIGERRRLLTHNFSDRNDKDANN